MKEDKGCLRHFQALLTLLVLIAAGLCALPARAGTAPDNFREQILTQSAGCHVAFTLLSETYWPGRDYEEVIELKDDARRKASWALEYFRAFATGYSEQDIENTISQNRTDITNENLSNESLLDMALYCVDKLNALEAIRAENDYTQ